MHNGDALPFQHLDYVLTFLAVAGVDLFEPQLVPILELKYLLPRVVVRSSDHESAFSVDRVLQEGVDMPIG